MSPERVTHFADATSPLRSHSNSHFHYLLRSAVGRGFRAYTIVYLSTHSRSDLRLRMPDDGSMDGSGAKGSETSAAAPPLMQWAAIHPVDAHRGHHVALASSTASTSGATHASARAIMQLLSARARGGNHARTGTR